MVQLFYRFFLGKELLYAFVHVFYRFFLAKELLYAFVLRVHYRNAAALAGSSQTSILDVALEYAAPLEVAAVSNAPHPPLFV